MKAEQTSVPVTSFTSGRRRGAPGLPPAPRTAAAHGREEGTGVRVARLGPARPGPVQLGPGPTCCSERRSLHRPRKPRPSSSSRSASVKAGPARNPGMTQCRNGVGSSTTASATEGPSVRGGERGHAVPCRSRSPRARPGRTVLEPLPAGPGRPRTLPQRRVPEGSAELCARLAPPALGRRRRCSATLGGHGTAWPDCNSLQPPRFARGAQSDRAGAGREALGQ